MKRSFNAAQVPLSIALESVQVASPCHADWNAMRGDDRSRFCPACAKNVYNLSAMTRGEAEMLLQEKEGRLCVRFFQREDGTMLTQDCPVGIAALKERSPSFALWAGVASLLALLGALVSPSLITGAHAQPETPLGEAPTQTITPSPTVTPELKPPLLVEMGDVDIAVLSPTPAPTRGAVLESLGEMRVVVPNHASTTPTPITIPLMGKPSMPVATPTPHSVRPTMGRIARPHNTPTPAPPKDLQVATLGMVALTPTPSHPSKKSRGASQKQKNPVKKQR